MSKILQLTPYPLEEPVHGGQIRCWQIRHALRHAGFDVQHFAMSLSAGQKRGPDDRLYPSDSPHGDGRLPYLFDYFAGRHALLDAPVREHLEQLFLKQRPDAILVDQPYLYDVACWLRERHAPNCRIVVSTQNVEWRLKAAMPVEPALEGVSNAFVKDIQALERRATLGADLVIACTQTDEAEFREWGAKNTAVAPNGIEPFTCSDTRTADWRAHFGEERYAVFVGSAHPPNADGFWKMMAPGLGFLRPGEHIVVLGSVCSLIPHHPRMAEFEALNLKRLVLAGILEKLDLQAIIMASHVVVLPIAGGEGSNLKTAEALHAGKWIVGTSKAFRGYEFAMDLPNVSVCDTPTEFRQAIVRALDNEPAQFSLPEAVRRRIEWEFTLEPLVTAVTHLLGRPDSLLGASGHADTGSSGAQMLPKA
jgi:glycosyltransferase involved in cell wall biosynthesis